MTAETVEHTDIVDAVLVEDEQERQLIDDAKALLQSVEIGREDAGYLRLAHERQRAIRKVLRMFQQASIAVPLPPIVAGIGELFDQKYTEAATHMELARWGLKDHLPRADAWIPKPHKAIAPRQFAELPKPKPPEFNRDEALAGLTRQANRQHSVDAPPDDPRHLHDTDAGGNCRHPDCGWNDEEFHWSFDDDYECYSAELARRRVAGELHLPDEPEPPWWRRVAAWAREVVTH